MPSKSAVPTYRPDDKDPTRAAVRWTDPKTGKRRNKRFPGDYGSPESRAAYRIWLNQFQSATDAAQQAAKIREEHRRYRELSVAELMELWIADYARQYGERHQNTHAARYAALAICEIFAATLVRDITAGDLAAVRDALNDGDLARTEVNRRLYAIRRAFRWGRERSLVPAVVVADLDVVRGVPLGRGRENPDPIVADPIAVNAIIEDLGMRNPRAARIVGFIRWTGCRPSEACRAIVGWVDRARRRLVIPADVAKTRRPRIVPLNGQALKIVDDAIAEGGRIDPVAVLFPNTKGKAYTDSGIYQSIAKTAKRLGLPHQTPYGLRRLAATEVLHATGSEAEAAALLGHSTRSRIVERYTRDRAPLADRAAQFVGRSLSVATVGGGA